MNIEAEYTIKFSRDEAVLLVKLLGGMSTADALSCGLNGDQAESVAGMFHELDAAIKSPDEKKY
jgi:hypothetical protein